MESRLRPHPWEDIDCLLYTSFSVKSAIIFWRSFCSLDSKKSIKNFPPIRYSYSYILNNDHPGQLFCIIEEALASLTAKLAGTDHLAHQRLGTILGSPVSASRTSITFRQISKPTRSPTCRGPIGWLAPRHIAVSISSGEAVSYTHLNSGHWCHNLCRIP